MPARAVEKTLDTETTYAICQQCDWGSSRTPHVVGQDHVRHFQHQVIVMRIDSTIYAPVIEKRTSNAGTD